MSSNESSWVRHEKAKFDETELSEFISTGYQGAEKLKLAGKNIGFSSAGDNIAYRKELTGYISPDGENLDALVNTFNEWSTKNKATKEKHKAYVDAMKERPGRDATILVPSSGPENKTILGATASKRTVLG